jgi:hypothetical protein
MVSAMRHGGRRLIQSATGLAALLAVAGTAWADPRQPLIKRLDDATRARVLAAMAGLIILGFAMVLLTWLGARVVQRYRRSTPFFRPTQRPGEHDWARRPLSEADETDQPPADSA